jgi:hypothetical protein
MIVYFKIVKGHVISHDILRIVFLEFYIDKFDFLQGCSLFSNGQNLTAKTYQSARKKWAIPFFSLTSVPC